MPNTREKLSKLLRGSIHFHEEKDEAWIIGGKQGERPSIFDSEADYIIAHGVGFLPRWIPVTERLPEVVDTYLVVVKYKYDWEDEYDIDVDVATYNPYEKAYIDDCWNTYNDWDEGQQYIHVTHWMPLPQPPEGE